MNRFPVVVRPVVAVMALLLVGFSSFPAAADEMDPDPVLGAMHTEMLRTFNSMKTADAELPYFVLYRLTREKTFRVMAANGAVYTSDSDDRVVAYAEVRVGSYQEDNTYVSEDTPMFWDDTDLYRPSPLGPVSLDPMALRTTFWMLSEEAYLRAVKDLWTRKGQKVITMADADRRGVGTFSMEQPVQYKAPLEGLRFDASRWETTLADLSRRYTTHNRLMQSNIGITAMLQRNYLVTSEGTRLRTDHIIWQFTTGAQVLTDDGDIIPYAITLYSDSPKIFTAAHMGKQVDRVIDILQQLAVAPVMDPYTGPALLMPLASGVLFHEAVGHRLEGERNLLNNEGRTFNGKLGKEVIPAFLSMYDDPTMESYDGVALNGFYRYDDEGVPARPVTLIKNGVLKTYLMSRTPIKGVPNSNGHGRAAPGMKPRARMGVTIVEADKKHTVSLATLKKKLVELVKSQGKPYGIIIQEMTGGDTNTSTYGYQAFRGASSIMYRIFPDGREELVRGVEVVGTPLTSINKILLASKKRGVFNGYCGAESGMVPVSAIAPALLLREVELQRTKQKSVPAPILPSPFNEKTGAAPAKP